MTIVLCLEVFLVISTLFLIITCVLLFSGSRNIVAWSMLIISIRESCSLDMRNLHRRFLSHVILLKQNGLATRLLGGVCRISRGVRPTLKFLGFWIYMTRSGMSRAAKLRAFARGGWGHAPTKKW